MIYNHQPHDRILAVFPSSNPRKPPRSLMTKYTSLYAFSALTFFAKSPHLSRNENKTKIIFIHKPKLAAFCWWIKNNSILLFCLLAAIILIPAWHRVLSLDEILLQQKDGNEAGCERHQTHLKHCYSLTEIWNLVQREARIFFFKDILCHCDFLPRWLTPLSKNLLKFLRQYFIIVAASFVPTAISEKFARKIHLIWVVSLFFHSLSRGDYKLQFCLDWMLNLHRTICKIINMKYDRFYLFRVTVLSIKAIIEQFVA